jgi:hypothetical protein
MKALLFMASLWLSTAPSIAWGNTGSVEAIWRRQVVSFEYRADETTYSCRILWQKISGMLLYVGARTAAPFEGFQCNDFAGTVRLQIALESPVEATPENLRAATDYDTRDLLVARLQGGQLPTAGDVARFPAAWTTLALRESHMQLTSADCELVQQLRRQVLPKLSVEVVQEPARCVPTLSRGRAPALKVRALLVAG